MKTKPSFVEIISNFPYSFSIKKNSPVIAPAIKYGSHYMNCLF